MMNNKTFMKYVLDSTKDLDNKKEIIKTKCINNIK